MKKKNNMYLTHRILMLSGSLLFALSSCTKEKPFDQKATVLLKSEVVDKALIDTDSEYIYSASQQMSSMSSEEAFPYYTSDNKRVKIKMTENSMQIIEMERDQRFASNTNNNKLVLEIPVTHIQFECAKDAYGECTNTETQSTDIPWQKRNEVKIDASKITTGQMELLPLIDYTNAYTNCYQDKSSELLVSSVESDAINFEIKKTFLVSPHCLGDIRVLSDATISAVYHYSLVKVKSVVSPDYKTISYPISSTDEKSFGFFTTSALKLDVDLNATENSTKQIMNRWNPNRKVINYFLSDEFAKPENKLLSDLTFQTVDKLNQGLEESGVKFRINLQQGHGKVPGDIRNSMIVLVEDPVASSVIGYGPQTEDPVTGEIISARTIMFLGTIKTFIKSTYNDIIEAKKDQKEAAIMAQKQASVSEYILAPKIKDLVAAKVKSGLTYGINGSLAKMAEARLGSKPTTPTVGSSDQGLQVAATVNSIKSELKVYTKRNNEEYSGHDLATKFKYMQEVKNCAFRPQAGGLSTSISQKLMDQFKDDAKPWDQLSDEDKQLAINIILPEIWGVTLIHEMGHNLGLRHNFQGSEDKENFFTKEELAAKNIDHEIPFSTVMEYGDDLKASPVLGKYDIAALKFGYGRQVEVVAKDGSVSKMDVPETLDQLTLPEGSKLKDYGYCTDEHTGINAGCRRFDLGTSYTEIVQNMISDYEKFYQLRNFRNGRENMSLIGDLSYAGRINGIFSDLRTMLEVKERIKYRYNLADSSPLWSSIPFLKDLNEASALAGQHLAKVLAVPDVTCAVVEVEKPNELIPVNINAIDPEATSCFKVQLPAKYKVVAQAGKMFNSKKDPESKNSYADQIDVRGYWIDKVLAAKNLFKRKTGVYTFDKSNQDSFLDHAAVGKPALSVVESMLNNNMVDKVEFTFENGQKASFEIPYDIADSQIIDKHISSRIAERLGINTEGPTRIQQVVSSVLASNAKDVTGANPQDESLGPVLSVFRFSDATTNHNAKGSLQLELGQNMVYVATKQNAVAQEMITNLRIGRIIEAVDQKTFEAIVQAKTEGKTPEATASAEEKAVWKLDLETLLNYKNEVIKNSRYYENMIQILPSAN